MENYDWKSVIPFLFWSIVNESMNNGCYPYEKLMQ